MNRSYHDIPRSVSVSPIRNKTSILKDPSKSKLKHNRSVRFLDLSDSEDSEMKSPVCQQQIKEVPKTEEKFLNNYFKFLKRESCVSQNAKFITKEEKPKEEAKKAPIVKCFKKSFHSSASPRVDQKLISYEFRNKDFYAKLNRFISGKGYQEIPLNKVRDNRIN